MFHNHCERQLPKARAIISHLRTVLELSETKRKRKETWYCIETSILPDLSTGSTIQKDKEQLYYRGKRYTNSCKRKKKKEKMRAHRLNRHLPQDDDLRIRLKEERRERQGTYVYSLAETSSLSPKPYELLWPFYRAHG